MLFPEQMNELIAVEILNTVSRCEIIRPDRYSWHIASPVLGFGSIHLFGRGLRALLLPVSPHRFVG